MILWCKDHAPWIVSRDSIATREPGETQLTSEAIIEGLPGRTARQLDFDRLTAALVRDVPAIVLFNSTRIAAAQPYVRGFSEWPAGEPRYWNVALH